MRTGIGGGVVTDRLNISVRCGDFSSHLAARQQGSSLRPEVLVANDGNDERQECDGGDDDAA